MARIQYAVWKKETGDAGGKAKNDAFDIAREFGFESSYSPASKRWRRIIQQLLSMHKFDNAEVSFAQYPAIDYRLLKIYEKHIKKTNSIALVHDLRCAQGLGFSGNIDEISHFKHFDNLIVHNSNMGTFVRELGYQGNIVELGIFDYLHDHCKPIQQPQFDGSIVFAGSLTKSAFLPMLNELPNNRFLLYGNKGELSFPYSNVEYKGLIPSDEIVYKLLGDYGLVWDGDSIDRCSGKEGEYLKYNNPHKLSLYIASGKPVITWKQAAIAKFVEEHEIGVVVESLRDLPNLSDYDQYQKMRKNVLVIKERLSHGYYLKAALEKILDRPTEF